MSSLRCYFWIVVISLVLLELATLIVFREQFQAYISSSIHSLISIVGTIVFIVGAIILMCRAAVR